MKIKNKGGRPRKAPTYNHTIRMSQSVKEFCGQLDNANRFVIDIITNTPEYKLFIENRERQNQAQEKSLF